MQILYLIKQLLVSQTARPCRNGNQQSELCVILKLLINTNPNLTEVYEYIECILLHIMILVWYIYIMYSVYIVYIYYDVKYFVSMFLVSFKERKKFLSIYVPKYFHFVSNCFNLFQEKVELWTRYLVQICYTHYVLNLLAVLYTRNQTLF